MACSLCWAAAAAGSCAKRRYCPGVDKVRVCDVRVLVLAQPDDSAPDQTRGKLFESFVARLMADSYGFRSPETSNLNVTSNGIELDVMAEHRLMSGRAIAECKAYTSNVAAKELTNFIGKLTLERMEHPATYGLMCVLPRLVAPGEEKARQAEKGDANFRYLSGTEIVAELGRSGVISGPPFDLGPTSDEAVVITSDGVYSTCIRLDPFARTPVSVAVWGIGAVPGPALDAIRASDYSLGLDVADVGAGRVSGAAPVAVDPPLLSTVTGSSSDFEYQLPAGPKFFVGRGGLLTRLETLLDRSGTIVLNAQSGWGKSSLALKVQERAAAAGGSAKVFDTRTASSARYVVEALRSAAAAAEESGLLLLPEDQSWASLSSALGSLKRSTWQRPGSPLVVFFDQFENVFANGELTRAFRDLALGVREVPGPFVVGFAWKTDLVGWVEGHPYQERDEIRAVADVVLVDLFGVREVNTLLGRLEKATDQKLIPDLKGRLREYSQGLPWLLKKLADHVLRELRSGVTQEQLLAETLNVQALFEADLAELDLHQREVLQHVARYAPVAASEVTDRFGPGPVQSLVDRRLVVQVGDRLDTYWDTFRDFLNTGQVPIEDSYILRLGPNSVARLLAGVVSSGGRAAVPALADSLATSPRVVFNLSRELRLLGVTAYEPNWVRILPEVLDSDDRERAMRGRVASALRRHRAYSAFRGLAERLGGSVTLNSFAREMPSAFPAVEVAESAWRTYAGAFLAWFAYAGLADQVGQDYRPTPEGSETVALRLLEGQSGLRARRGVPQVPPRRSLELLDQVLAGESVVVGGDRREREPVVPLVALGAIRVDHEGAVVAGPEFAHLGRNRALAKFLREVPGGAAGLAVLEDDPQARPAVVGTAIRGAVGASWSDESTKSIGNHFRAWAKAAGIAVERPPRVSGRRSGTGSADADGEVPDGSSAPTLPWGGAPQSLS